MPGYQTRIQSVFIEGSGHFSIQSLLDRQQFYDPHQFASSLGISSAIWPLFGQLWPSGVLLARQLALRPVCQSEKILEIGCGLAVASLAAHRRGANITASDCHPLAGHFLETNLQLNQLPPIPYKHGQWGRAAAIPDGLDVVRLAGKYDLIVGSDLLYERDTPLALSRFIHQHAAPKSEVWVVDPDRGHRPAFNRKMRLFGFELQNEKKLPRRLRIDKLTELPYKGRLLIYTRSAGHSIPSGAEHSIPSGTGHSI